MHNSYLSKDVAYYTLLLLLSVNTFIPRVPLYPDQYRVIIRCIIWKLISCPLIEIGIVFHTDHSERWR